MAIMTEITTPTDINEPSTTPRRVLQAVPSVEIEVASLVPLRNEAIPFFWVWGEELDKFEKVLRDDQKVRDVKCLERVDGGALYRVGWSVDSPLIMCIHFTNGALIEAYGTAEKWVLTVWFEHREDAKSFRECCSNHDVPMSITKIKSVSDHASDREFPITNEQREALILAYERGYFKNPREVSQRELGEELDISSSAVSSRLRRGFNNVIEELVSR